MPAEQARQEKLPHRLHTSSVNTEDLFLSCSVSTAVSLGCSSSTGFTNAKRQRTLKANALEWQQLKVDFTFPVELTNRVLGFPKMHRALVGNLLSFFSTSLPWLKRLKTFKNTSRLFYFCRKPVEGRVVREDQQHVSHIWRCTDAF